LSLVSGRYIDAISIQNASSGARLTGTAPTTAWQAPERLREAGADEQRWTVTDNGVAGAGATAGADAAALVPYRGMEFIGDSADA